MVKRTITIRRIAKPFTVFASVFVIFILLPTAYIAFSDYYSNRWYSLRFDEYRLSAMRSLAMTSLFFVCFSGGYLISSLNSSSSRKQKSKPLPSHRQEAYHGRRSGIKVINPLNPSSYYILKKHNFFYWMALISIILVWLNFALGGYEKLSQFGQDISKMEYRLIGFNDRNRILTAILQLARRLTLPFCAIYFILIAAYSKNYSKVFIISVVFSLLVGIVITLDRGPFMLFLVMFAYIFYCTSKNTFRIGIYGLVLVGIMITLGGALTFIQHNIQDFSFDEVLDTGNEFIVNRVIMAPNFVPIELSYGLFDFSSDKLWLKHARITALFTGEYVGTLQDNSVYVSPVGAVADIWRNTGLTGIILIGIFIGFYFKAIEKLINYSDPIISVAASFTVITLVFYFVYGTFFSQGVFLQMVFLYFILKYVQSDGKIHCHLK
ncbi:hypothetical protein [Alterisphingorhabdus coralli]|uniref:Oligosaccharide repeat unit polymerase n=1 Tax=Alterisphingorhabdus coralli TaxID=3071408 RepID=A0AA97F5M0_9SPHN|nr:hypothetical protein [Parasphingorhabdus sp. SCSIO 66989]WOE74804.1 hypothetical protein RB602_13295 [Parasphingorhabdus sp. SCSIO 66989]